MDDVHSGPFHREMKRSARKVQVGRERGRDIGELFDDLDYFLLMRGYPQPV